MKIARFLAPSTGYRLPLLSYWTVWAILLFSAIAHFRGFYDWQYPDTAHYYRAWDSIRNFVPDLLRTPVYPLIITSFKYLFGLYPGRVAVYVLQWVAFAMAVVYFRKTASILLKSPKATFWATCIFALNLDIHSYHCLILTESLALSFIVFFIWNAVEYACRLSRRRLVVATVWLVTLIFLRPAFSYLLVVFPLFLILLCFRHRAHKKQIMALGAAAFLTVCALFGGYVALMNRHYGIHSPTGISSYNHLYALAEEGALDSVAAHNPFVRNTLSRCVVDSLASNYSDRYNLTEFYYMIGTANIEAFVDSTFAANRIRMLRFMLEKRFPQDLMPYEFTTTYGYSPRQWKAVRPQIPIVVVPVFLCLYLCVLIFVACRRRLVPVVSLFLWMLGAGLFVTAWIGAMAEYSRLIMPAYPVYILMFMQMVYACVRRRISICTS